MRGPLSRGPLKVPMFLVHDEAGAVRCDLTITLYHMILCYVIVDYAIVYHIMLLYYVMLYCYIVMLYCSI